MKSEFYSQRKILEEIDKFRLKLLIEDTKKELGLSFDQINENRSNIDEKYTLEMVSSFLPINEYGQNIYSKVRTDEADPKMLPRLSNIIPEGRDRTLYMLLKSMADFASSPTDFLETEDNPVEKMKKAFSLLMAYKAVLQTFFHFERRTSGKNMEFILAGLSGGYVPEGDAIEDFIVVEGGRDVLYSLKAIKKNERIQGSFLKLFDTVVAKGQDVIFLTLEKSRNGKPFDIDSFSKQGIKAEEFDLEINFQKVTKDKVIEAIITDNGQARFNPGKTMFDKIKDSDQFNEMVRLGLLDENFTLQEQGQKGAESNNLPETDSTEVDRILEDVCRDLINLQKYIKKNQLGNNLFYKHDKLTKLLKTKSGTSNTIDQVINSGGFKVPDSIFNYMFFSENYTRNKDKETGIKKNSTSSLDLLKNLRSEISDEYLSYRPGSRIGRGTGKLFRGYNRDDEIFNAIKAHNNIVNFLIKADKLGDEKSETSKLKAILTENVSMPRDQQINNYINLFSLGKITKNNREIKLEFKAIRETFIKYYCDPDQSRDTIKLTLSKKHFFEQTESIGESLKSNYNIIFDTLKFLSTNLNSFNKELKETLSDGLSEKTFSVASKSLDNMSKSWKVIESGRKIEGISE